LTNPLVLLSLEFPWIEVQDPLSNIELYGTAEPNGTPELDGTMELGGIPKLSDGIDDAGYITICSAGGGTAFVPSNGGITVGINAPDTETAVRTGGVAPIIGGIAPLAYH